MKVKRKTKIPAKQLEDHYNSLIENYETVMRIRKDQVDSLTRRCVIMAEHIDRLHEQIAQMAKDRAKTLFTMKDESSDDHHKIRIVR